MPCRALVWPIYRQTETEVMQYPAELAWKIYRRTGTEVVEYPSELKHDKSVDRQRSWSILRSWSTTNLWTDRGRAVSFGAEARQICGQTEVVQYPSELKHDKSVDRQRSYSILRSWSITNLWTDRGRGVSFGTQALFTACNTTFFIVAKLVFVIIF